MNLIVQALSTSFSMFYQVLWSLILGILLSSVITVLIPSDKISHALGREGFKETALATLLGAISSSCSYAAASASKALFKKGAGFIPSLAFLFSSTNLVIELGVILFLLLGWQFTLAEWLGGVVLIAIMAVSVKLTYPKKLIEQARKHEEVHNHEHNHQHSHQASKLKMIAQNFVMEISMLKKDLVLGFLIAGALAVLIPTDFWNVLLLKNQPELVRITFGALIGPIIAILSFVCSIGNVPLAAVLWTRGLGFSGVLSFLYADLIVIPLLDIYKKYYGLKMAVYIGGIFFVTMVLSGIIMYIPFKLLNQIPAVPSNLNFTPTFSLNYTFWLNLVFIVIAVYMAILSKRSGSSDKDMTM